jgi:hypothetical protein
VALGTGIAPSEYCDWLRNGRPRCRCSSPGRAMHFRGSTRPDIQWVHGAPPRQYIDRVVQMVVYMKVVPTSRERGSYT